MGDRLDITALIMDDHEWFRRQFARLDDASKPAELAAVWEPLAVRLDTHAQADAVAEAGRYDVGTDAWFEAVGRARAENTEHLGEEEDEALPDFRKHASEELRHRLGELWVQFYAQHPDGRDIRTGTVDPDEYIDQNS